MHDVLPSLEKTRFARLFANARALDPDSRLDVDERKVTFTLAGDARVPAVRLPLALPPPWSGTVAIVPRAVEGRWCAPVHATLFDQDLREADVEGMPLDLEVTVQKRGAPAKTTSIKQDALVFTPNAIVAKSGDADALRLFIGDGPPDDDVLELDGADLYMKSLAAIDPAIVDDIRAHPSPQAQRVLFAEVAASLRSSLPQWRPDKRLAVAQRFDEKAMPPELKPLLRFWKEELGRKGATAHGATAHIIVDEAVQALYLDGVAVFDRKAGTPTGFDIKVPKQALRAWIVTDEQVHDTRAVLRPGEIYNVTPTFVQAVKGGGVRKECVRVVGKLPFDQTIRWREIAGIQTPLLGDDETYRPSGSSTERAFSVIPPGAPRPFPPVPLVYSYTHPGLYKWTLGADGSVKLELIDDEPGICDRKP